MKTKLMIICLLSLFTIFLPVQGIPSVIPYYGIEGVKSVGTLNPYPRVESETIAFSEGVKSELNAQTEIYISDIHNGDYIKVREVYFGTTSPANFNATLVSAL